jgi:hypothetical protein
MSKTLLGSAQYKLTQSAGQTYQYVYLVKEGLNRSAQHRSPSHQILYPVREKANQRCAVGNRPDMIITSVTVPGKLIATWEDQFNKILPIFGTYAFISEQSG